MHNQVSDGLGKIGVIVALESTGSAEALNELGKKIAQHIAAINPLALDATCIAQDVVLREKAVLAEKNGAGKPPHVIEKIVESGMKSFFKENCLVDQVSIMPSTPISVAVSKPSPKRNPSGYMCQLRRIMRNTGRKTRASRPRFDSSRSRSSST